MRRNPEDYLTSREHNILRLLSEGKTYQQIQDKLGIHPACIHMHTYRIRLKTGIKDTQDLEEVRAFVRDYRPRLSEPTTLQKKILRMWLDGKSHAEIALALGLTKGTTMNQASLGIRRMGIIGRKRHRYIQVKALMDGYEEREPSPMDADEFQ